MGVLLLFFSKLMYACFHIPGYSVHLVITSSAKMGLGRQEALVPFGNSIGAHRRMKAALSQGTGNVFNTKSSLRGSSVIQFFQILFHL